MVQPLFARELFQLVLFEGLLHVPGELFHDWVDSRNFFLIELY